MAKTRKKRNAEQGETQQSISEPLAQLHHQDPETRSAAWTTLRRVFLTTPQAVSLSLVNRLLDVQVQEKDAKVWQTASRVIELMYLQMHRKMGQTPRPTAKPSLGRWLWEDFQEQSVVLRVADPDRLRRDEDAVIEIARCLPHTEFPQTDFLCVKPGGFAPNVADLVNVEALCFVGRLCLYGTDALQSWCPKKHPARYRFGMEVRPHDLPPGELHPEYHSIVPQTAGADEETRYRADEVDGVRTDYGLVRRYTLRRSGRLHVVIHIAGCSSLGTLAAAHFATHELLHADPDGELLPLPREINRDSQLEALIQTTAETHGSELGWRLKDTKVLDLRVDDFIWREEEENPWQPRIHEVIKLDFRACSARGRFRAEYRRVKVSVDDELVNLHPESENRRLCIALCLLAKDNGGKAELEELAADLWIWSNRQPQTVAHVSNRLGNLHRYFANSIVIQDSVCRVIPEIRIL